MKWESLLFYSLNTQNNKYPHYKTWGFQRSWYCNVCWHMSCLPRQSRALHKTTASSFETSSLPLWYNTYTHTYVTANINSQYIELQMKHVSAQLSAEWRTSWNNVWLSTVVRAPGTYSVFMFEITTVCVYWQCIKINVGWRVSYLQYTKFEILPFRIRNYGHSAFKQAALTHDTEPDPGGGRGLLSTCRPAQTAQQKRHTTFLSKIWTGFIAECLKMWQLLSW
jgi:hypothetical protein